MTEFEKEIKILKSKLTGNMFQDMEIKEEIHQLEMREKGVVPTCSLGDECENCSG